MSTENNGNLLKFSEYLKDIFRRKGRKQSVSFSPKKSIFVGRKEHIEQLENLLSSHLQETDKRVRVISIYGKSGVGKSYLVNHILDEFDAQLKKHLKIKIFYSPKNMYSLASVFTGQLITNANVNLKKFRGLRKTRKVIENIDRQFIAKSIKDKNKNAEISRKLFNDAQVVGIKGFLAYIKNKAGVEDLDISDDDIKELISNLPANSYNSVDRILNTKKYRVDNNLQRELATDLLNDIERMTKRNILRRRYRNSLIFIIDDYEGLKSIADSIFFNELIGPLKNQKINSLFIFIGREELDWKTSWRFYNDTQEPSIELKTFNDEEAGDYLEQMGISNASDRRRIINKSQRLPLLLEILANATINHTEAKWVEDYFNRITAHMDNQQKEWLKRVCFLDTRVDQDTISVMLGDNVDQAKKAFDWFKNEGTAYINTPDGWEVDPIVKTLVQEKVEQDSLAETHEYKKQAQKAKEKYEELKSKVG